MVLDWWIGFASASWGIWDSTKRMCRFMLVALSKSQNPFWFVFHFLSSSNASFFEAVSQDGPRPGWFVVRQLFLFVRWLLHYCTYNHILIQYFNHIFGGVLRVQVIQLRQSTVINLNRSLKSPKSINQIQLMLMCFHIPGSKALFETSTFLSDWGEAITPGGWAPSFQTTSCYSWCFLPVLSSKSFSGYNNWQLRSIGPKMNTPPPSPWIQLMDL